MNATRPILLLTATVAFALAALQPPAARAQFLPGIIKRHTPAPASPSPSPSPYATDTGAESPSASPTPTPSPTPAARGVRRPLRRPRVTPAPPATPTSAPQPTAEPATPAPTPVAPLVTPAPPRPQTQPQEPTIPQALADPRVRESLSRPIGELARFAWMAGTWNARDIVQLPGGRTRDLGLNTYVFAETMKGRWLFGADGKAKDELYITYDALAGQYVLVRIEADPSYGVWVSRSGWTGNQIAFTSSGAYADGRLYRRRVTIVRRDARSFSIYDDEQLPNGVWLPDDEIELTKTT